MPEYCTATDVQNRLTEAGIKYVADRDRSGTVSAGETAAYVTSAIEWAGSLIDGSLCARTSPASARAQASAGTCSWLVHRAVDLAAYRAAGHGGRDVPESLAKAYSEAWALLIKVRDNQSPVPGLIEDRPINGRSTIGPRVVNVT